MEMTFRWYGSKHDTVSLRDIRQIPGVTGIITTLYDAKPGDVWTEEQIKAMIDEVAASGLHISGIESVNVSDAIKAALPEREDTDRTSGRCAQGDLRAFALHRGYQYPAGGYQKR